MPRPAKSDARRIGSTTVALRAARSYALLPLVVLLEPGKIDRPVGSGTIVRTQRGCKVLTCKRVLTSQSQRLVAQHVSDRELAVEIERVIAHLTLISHSLRASSG